MSVLRRPAAVPRANMTPLIDVVFLLIIFFMLVAQIAREQLVELELVRLDASSTVEITREGKVVINVLPEAEGDARGEAYRMGTLGFNEDELDRLTGALISLRQRRPELGALVRASRGERFERVRPVLGALRGAGLSQVEIVVATTRGAS